LGEAGVGGGHCASSFSGQDITGWLTCHGGSAGELHGFFSCRILVFANASGAFYPSAGCFVQCSARVGRRDCALGFPLGPPSSCGASASGTPGFCLQIKIYYILC
jgi:hypothetical protein